MTNTVKSFNAENCQTQTIADNLFKCLVPEQAHLCKSCLPFGHGYLCKHPRRSELTKISSASQSKFIAPSQASPFDQPE